MDLLLCSGKLSRLVRLSVFRLTFPYYFHCRQQPSTHIRALARSQGNCSDGRLV